MLNFFAKKRFPVLKNRDFLKLWASQVLGQVGLNTLYFTLIIQVYQSSGSNFAVGALIAVMSLPAVFLAPIAGVFADIFSRRNLLIVINIGRLLLTLLVFVSYEIPAILMVLAFFITAASQFFLPTEQSSIPDLVKKEHLMQANTFFTFSMYSSFLIGFAGAGPLIDYGGLFATIVVVSVCFLLASILNTTLPSLSGHIEDRTETIKDRLRAQRVWSYMKEGVACVRERPLLLKMIIQVAFIFSVERAVISLVPELASRFFGFSVAEISFFMIIPLALGTVGGVALVNKLKYSWTHSRIIRLGLALDAVALIALPYHKYIWSGIQSLGVAVSMDLYTRIHVVSIAFVSGLADVLIIVSMQTFIQWYIGTSQRGRVFANLQTTMNVLSIPLVLVISIMADVINISFVLLGFGLATLVVMGFKKDNTNHPSGAREPRQA